jgi:hypothetical protein
MTGVSLSGAGLRTVGSRNCPDGTPHAVPLTAVEAAKAETWSGPHEDVHPQAARPITTTCVRCKQTVVLTKA